MNSSKDPKPNKTPIPRPQEKSSQIRENKNELDDLISRVKQGNKKITIDSKGNSRGILILGETGVGKSTIAYIFAGRHMVVKKSPENEYYIDLNDQPLYDITIGHKKASETIIPGKVKIQDFVLWDCPGFSDIGRNAMQDIANAFYIQRLFETHDELKFLLVLPYDHLLDRAQNAVRMLEFFARMFGKIGSVKGSVCLLITRADEKKTKKSICANLNAILEHNKQITQNARELITMLSDPSHIELFYALNEEGELTGDKYNQITESLRKNFKYFNTQSCKINVVISETSVPLATSFMKNTFEALDKLVAEFDAIFTSNCLQNGQLIDQIDDMFYRNDLGISLLESTAYLRDYLFIESLNVLGNSLNHLTEKKESEEFFDRLIKTMKTTLTLISQFHNQSEIMKNPFASPSERERFAEKIHDVSNCMKFLLKALNSPMVNEFFKGVLNKFESMEKGVQDILSQKIRNLKITKQETRTLYYEKIIEYLTPYEKEPEIQKKISFAHFCLAKILLDKRLVTDAIINAINSYNYDSCCQEVMMMLDKIFDENRDKLKILQKENLIDIIADLFSLNMKKTNKLFEDAKTMILAFFQIENERRDIFDFIDSGFEILKKIGMITHQSLPNDKVFALLIEILGIIDENKDFSNQTTRQVDYTWQILNLNSSQTLKDKFRDLLRIFDIEATISKILFEEMKKLKFEELKSVYSPEKLQKILGYSQDLQHLMKEKNGLLVWMQKEIHLEIGKKNIIENNYKEAAENFLKSIELSPRDNPMAYEGLEALYLLGFKPKIQKMEIFEEIDELSMREFESIFKKRVLFFVMDFIGERFLFRQNLNDLEYLDYLERIWNIYGMIKETYVNEGKDFAKEFLGLLEKIEEQMDPFAEMERIDEKLKQEAKVCVEKYFKPNFSYFAINLIENQLSFCQWFKTNELKKNNKSLQELVRICVDSLDNNVIFKRFREKMVNLEVSLIEKDTNYYLRILDLIDKVSAKEPSVFKDSSLCYLRLGDLEKEKGNTEDAVLNYEQAIDHIQHFYLFCQEKNYFGFYKQHSRKKEIVYKAGEILLSIGKYRKAFEIFKKINDHHNIKKCFKKLQETDQEDALFLEEKGDYYYEMGLIDKSIDSYHQARSFYDKPKDVARMYKKIAHALSSSGEKAKDFRETAEEILQHGVIDLGSVENKFF